MAKLYFLPRVALKAQDALLPLAWRLEAAVVRWTFRHLRRLPLEDAQGRAARWFRRIGPRTPVAQKLLRNLAILHPEAPLSALKVEARDSFAALGQAVAELAHSDAISENPEQFCEFVVDPAAEAALSDPKAPAVLITAHVGPWTFTNLIAAWGRFPLSIPLDDAFKGNGPAQALHYERLLAWERPVQFIWGCQDPVFLESWGRSWAARLNAPFDALEDAGHFPQNTHGKALAELILKRA